jgi:hemolysin III
LCLLALSGAWSVVMLATVWAGAVTGIVMKQFNIDGLRRVSGFLYITLGWISIVTLPQLFHTMSVAAFSLVVAGGLLYTVGAIVFAVKRPDPSPAVFGYHEIWHAFTAGAGLCHYSAVLLLIIAVH